MTRVVLQPARLEIGFFPEQYDALIRDLEAADYEVLLERSVEYRGGGAELGQAVVELVVHVVGDLEEEAIGAVIASLFARLRGTLRGRRRRVQVIWGSRGEKLREVELPEDESD